MASTHRWLVLLAAASAVSCAMPETAGDPPPPLATVVLSPAAASLSQGDFLDLAAAGLTAAGDTASISVTWAATGGVLGATTVQGGLHYLHYQATDCGDQRVIATGEPGAVSDTALITVTCPVPVASVTVTPGTGTVAVGATLQLTATPRDALGNALGGRTITWQSSAPTRATVDGRGLVTGVAAGTATITATAEGQSGTAAITVPMPVTPVASVTVTPGTGTVAVGATLQLTATPRDALGNALAGRTITWQSGAPTRATVDGQGLVTGMTAGNASVTATAESKSGTATVTVTDPTSTIPTFGHIVLVLEENTNYASVIGTSAMPYLTGLANQYGLATQYFANTHPSIGNYFMLTVGNIVTNDDAFTGTVTDDNLIRHLVAAGRTWRSYAEGLPSVGYTGDGPTPYVRRHNPMAYLSDVVNDPGQRANLVPFSQFAVDLAADQLPQFSFIAPNLCNDAHDCSLGTADQWLQTHLAPLLQQASFQRDGLLLIVFDESANDNTHGGGRIVWVAVGPRVRSGYRSTALYQHQSTLRLILQGLGLGSFPNAAATAPDMGEFFLP